MSDWHLTGTFSLDKNKSIFPITVFMEPLLSSFPNVTQVFMVWTLPKSTLWKNRIGTVTCETLQVWGTLHITRGMWLPGINATWISSNENAGECLQLSYYSGVSKQIQVFASMADNPGSLAVSVFQNMFLKKTQTCLCTRGNVCNAVTKNFLGVLKITYIAKRFSQEHWKLVLFCRVFLAENHVMWLHISW